MNKYELQHLANDKKIKKAIQALYDSYIKEYASLATSIPNLSTSKVFSFANYPITKARAQTIENEFRANLNTLITNGINESWDLSNTKNDALVDGIFGSSIKPSSDLYATYFNNNLEAKNAFLSRKIGGLSLSENVWKYHSQFKKEIELGLEVGLSEGKSASAMATELKQYLQYPDKLFRRVRDLKNGALILSKNAKAFHPSMGVYRSSYKNAMRLARTENNIAYRTADYTRWQELDFVVGQRVVLSHEHPVYDMCDDLKGDYPKNFIFTGWHPQCICHVITILKTQNELGNDIEKIGAGKALNGQSVNTVKSVPSNFNEWIDDHREGIIKAKNKPYFVKDNFKYGNVEKGLK